MTREQAEAERKRMAEENPEATWLVAEQEPGQWAVVKVGLKPSDSGSRREHRGAAQVRRMPDDPRTAQSRTSALELGGS